MNRELRREWNHRVFARRRRALRLSMREIREELLVLVEEARSEGQDMDNVPSLPELYRQLDSRGCRGPVDRRLARLLAVVVNLKEDELWRR